MYSDGAWPEAAGIDAFIEERRRPQQVTVAVWGFLSAAVFTLASGALYSVAGAGDSGFVLALPLWLVLTVSGLVAAWCVVTAVASWRGRGWAAAPARLTAAGLLVACGGFGALANPETTSMSGLGWGYTFFVLVAALSGGVSLVCLLGRAVSEYFNPPAASLPRVNQSGPAMTGNDADWAPPQQRRQSFPQGMQQPPPPGHHGRPPHR